MAKIDFHRIKDQEKIAIFKEIATRKGLSAFAVEKDWWLSRTLDIIFQMDIAKHLVSLNATRIKYVFTLVLEGK